MSYQHIPEKTEIMHIKILEYYSGNPANTDLKNMVYMYFNSNETFYNICLTVQVSFDI